MKTAPVRKKILCLFMLIFLLSAAMVLYLLHDRIADSLSRKLIVERSMPAQLGREGLEKDTLIYVLGGNQDSLLSRFRKASTLYGQGLSKRILILSRPGITEFSPELGRNLTNDEWSVRELERLEVRKSDVEPVSMPESFLGTFSESRNLADTVRKKGCRNLILVTSDYHTRRVYSTFSRNTSYDSVNLYVYGSGDSTDLRHLVVEHIKIFFYDRFVLPVSNRNGAYCDPDFKKNISML